MSAAIGTTAERVLDSFAGRAMSFVELRDASGVAPERLDNVVSTLVRHQFVRRVHNPDGILRYERTCAPARVTSIAAQTRDAVLSTLVAQGHAMRFAEIVAALKGRFTPTSLHNCLARMRDAGYIEHCGRTAVAYWRVTEFGRSVSPPSPGIARPDAATGPAAVVPHSPAPARTPAAATPHAPHASAPENLDDAIADGSWE